ncbi:hypothetical protein Sjap_011974 [Stephania japonica]|uniref:Uncharacterized protein n=1 Tax=Stephania japonica TaxID=461633 RepID=A0AAP0JC58_9MAGN
MGSREEGVVEIDYLERGLLEGRGEIENGSETVLYDASFEEMEEKYVKYQTAQWVAYSLLLMVAWGIGLLMLIYIPVRRYVLRNDFRSRKLYLTPDSIVYKAVLTRLSELRRGRLSRQVVLHDNPNMRIGYSPTTQRSPSRSLGHNAGELILQKLEEVEGSVKDSITLDLTEVRR